MTDARTKGKRVSGDSAQMTADFFNDLVDVVSAHKQTSPSEGRGTRATDRASAGIVTVLNKGAAALAQYDVCGITDPIFDPVTDAAEFKTRPTLRVRPATADDVTQFGVMIEPANVDATGRAVVSGVVQVKVDITDVDHNFADVDASDPTQLVSSVAGSAQILTREDSTSSGLQWCVVRLSNSQSSSSDNCGYEVRARCQGDDIENCTYYTCRDSETHDLVSRLLIECDTDSSSGNSGDPGGGGGIVIGACTISTTLYAKLCETTGNCTSCGTRVSDLITLTHNGTLWAGAILFCGEIFTVEFEYTGGLMNFTFRMMAEDTQEYSEDITTGVDCNDVNRFGTFVSQGSNGFTTLCGETTWSLEMRVHADAANIVCSNNL